MISLADLLSRWHDFYELIGTAGATLVGLMFVTASIGAGVFTRDQKTAMQSFITPTVVHFSAILIICIVAIAPDETWNLLGALMIGGGLIGLGYSGWTVRRMVTGGYLAAIDASDRMWYVLLPIAGYGIVIAAGLRLEAHDANGLRILALGLITLLLAGIRNAWDMTIWIIQRRQPG